MDGYGYDQHCFERGVFGAADEGRASERESEGIWSNIGMGMALLMDA